MKTSGKKNKTQLSIARDEKAAIKFLMEKMGLSKKEIIETVEKTGVSAFRIMEQMQFGKYMLLKREIMKEIIQPVERMVNTVSVPKLKTGDRIFT